MSHSGRPKSYTSLVLAVLACLSGIAPAEPLADDVTAPQPATQPADESTTQPGDQGDARSANVVESTQPGVFKELHMRDTNLRGALELLSRQSRVNIIATKDVSGDVAAIDLYNVTFEQALDAVTTSTGFKWYRDGASVYVVTQTQYDEYKASQRTLETRWFKLSYITGTDARTLVAPMLSEDGNAVVSPGAEVGVPQSQTETGGNSYGLEDMLIVKDYAEKIDLVAAFLKEIDIRPEQVLIEATILRVTLDNTNALGIDFNTLSGVDFNAFGSNTNMLTNVTGAAAGTATNTLSGSDATFRTDLAGGVGAGGLTLGFLSNKIAFFVRALETVSNTTILANPKLLVVNRQRGEVMVGRRDGYLTTTVTETTATETVEFLETGTRLVVRPFIASDGYIRMEIHPEDSAGSVAPVGTSVLPSQTTTEITSNVIVRDGHTLVIGGLFREETQEGRAQVPLVGNLPYVGPLFRRTTDSSDREEVIILITPHIIRNPIDDIVSEQVKDDVERYRVGARKGLQWWGKEQLAQTHVRWARENLRNGDIDKAVWDVDMALAIQPDLIEAIRMKEILSQNAYWSEEAQRSTVKSVVERMVMQELGKPVERVIPQRKPRDGMELPQDVREALGIGHRPEDPLPGMEDTAPAVDDQPVVEPDGRQGPDTQVKPSGDAADQIDSAPDGQGQE